MGKVLSDKVAKIFFREIFFEKNFPEKNYRIKAYDFFSKFYLMKNIYNFMLEKMDTRNKFIFHLK